MSLSAGVLVSPGPVEHVVRLRLVVQHVIDSGLDSIVDGPVGVLREVAQQSACLHVTGVDRELFKLAALPCELGLGWTYISNISDVLTLEETCHGDLLRHGSRGGSVDITALWTSNSSVCQESDGQSLDEREGELHSASGFGVEGVRWYSIKS